MKKFLFRKILNDGCFRKGFNTPSYEAFFKIKDYCPEFSNVFSQMSVCNLDDWHIDEMQRKLKRKEKNKTELQKDLDFFQKNLDGIKNGIHSNFIHFIIYKFIYEANKDNKFNLAKLYEHYPKLYCDAILEGAENLLKRNDSPKYSATCFSFKCLSSGEPPPINESISGVNPDKLWTILRRYINGTEALYGGADYRIPAAG